jgi:hypothetical protein
VLVHPAIPATQEAEAGESSVQDWYGKKLARPYLKNKSNNERAGDIAQIVQNLQVQHPGFNSQYYKKE